MTALVLMGFFCAAAAGLWIFKEYAGRKSAAAAAINDDELAEDWRGRYDLAGDILRIILIIGAVFLVFLLVTTVICLLTGVAVWEALSGSSFQAIAPLACLVALISFLLGILPAGSGSKRRSRAWLAFAIAVTLLLPAGTKPLTSLPNLFFNVGEGLGGSKKGVVSGVSSGVDEVVMDDLQGNANAAVALGQIAHRLNEMMAIGIETKNTKITGTLSSALRNPMNRAQQIMFQIWARNAADISLSRPARDTAYAIAAVFEQCSFGEKSAEWETYAALLEWRNDQHRRRQKWTDLYEEASRELQIELTGSIEEDFQVPSIIVLEALPTPVPVPKKP